MSAPQKVLELVDLFHRNADAYHAPQYNEAMVRQEFINPLFKCLGWDMDNEQGYAEAYKDVIHEAAIKIGGATKAPDYCFRIGGAAKFFLEAKRPSVNVKDDPAPAYQLRRYAWTGKLSLSVLTDFEEFAIYDCRVKPAHTDKAGVARILYLRYEDYPNRWDEITGVFSREAILKGSFDKFAESNKAKRGTAAVDTAFLQEIESWRDLLARNLALRNADLNQRGLNYAVQVTIDRIIFLRMCEDRGVEPYGQLQKLQQGSDIYSNLLNLYRKADERYNSGLFHFHVEKGRPEAPDTLTPSLSLDDKPLKDILHGLYYPECPYEFAVLSGEILGQVYEQFLGKVIRLTAGHQAKVEDKPEVRKAGGVYYTPTYIVAYIVKQTVGKLLEDKTPKQAAKLRILDPACGSGSFLLGAYQLLLDWHRDRYLADGAKKHPKELYQAAGDVWRLTTAEKKRILLANIYGVDIDPQAVEVTKLSLLLKVLEGESEQTLQSQLRMFHERALPDLSNNIQCGNSLIGPDFYNGQQLSMFDEEERYRINVFDWHAAFPWLRKAGGFDVVIGNPPYVGFHGFADQKRYLRKQYLSAQGKFDLYLPFIERSLRLLHEQGLLGFICPTNFMKRDHGAELRRFLKDTVSILEITDFQDVQIFKGALNYTGVFLIEKAQAEPNHQIRYRTRQLTGSNFEFLQRQLTADPWVFRSREVEAIVERVRMVRTSPLGEMAAGISEGIVTGQNQVFLLPRSRAKELDLEWELLRPCIRGRCLRRFLVDDVDEVVIYPYRLVGEKTLALSARELNRFPKVWNYLNEQRHELGGRAYFDSSSKEWYELWCQRDYRLLAAPKILVPELAESNRFALADTTHFYGDTVCGIVLLPNALEHMNYLLGLLNSRLLEFYYKATTVPKANGFFIYKTMFLKKMPIRRINFGEARDKTRHDRMVELVEQILALHARIAVARTPHEKTVLQVQIDTIDQWIDQLVYELYELTEEEIKIVEKGTAT